MPEYPTYPYGPAIEAQDQDRIITSPATSVTAFVGFVASGVEDRPVLVQSFREFEREFGAMEVGRLLSLAVHEFFLNGGRQAVVVRVGSVGPLGKDELIGSTATTGMNALLGAVDFNLLCIPDTFDLSDPDATAVAEAAIRLCEASHAFYLVDPPRTKGLHDIVAWVATLTASANAAVYFPAIKIANPRDNAQLLTVPPSGAVAGVVARTDANRGIWKSPSGNEATLNGGIHLALSLNDSESAVMNEMGINTLRSFPGRLPLVWGARTLAGAASRVDQFKYVSVMRLALHIQQALSRGTRWTVFEPIDEVMFAQLRLSIDAFMQGLFRDGALQGRTAREAYFVHCGAETTTISDMEQGIVNIQVGFSPSRPAEFVLLQLRQTR